MYCKKIAVKIPHWDRHRQKKSSFFVIEADRNEEAEVLQLIGNSKVDIHSMWRFKEWQQGLFKDIALLVSLDLKYLIVANLNELTHIYDPEVYLEVELNGDAGVYGNPEEKFLPVLRREVRLNPSLGELLGFKLPVNRAPIPRRIDLSGVGFGSLEMLDEPIRKAYLEPATAEVDALILAFLAKENWLVPVSTGMHDAVEFIIWGYCQSQGDNWPASGPLHLYQVTGLSLEELVQRRIRAKRLRDNYRRRFPNRWNFETAESAEEVRRFLGKLTDDEIVEMAVVSWYSSEMPGAREKLALMVASERFGRQGDYS